MQIRYGGLYTADLAPRFATEPGKRRSVIVVQADAMNLAGHPSTIACVCSTRLYDDPSHPLRVRLRRGEGGIDRESDVLVDQVRAMANRRLKKDLGDVPPGKLAELRVRLARVLAFD